MRVIGGLFRSRRLRTLPGARTRPTSDRLRETLFNVLGSVVKGSQFADAYAGSGAVGIEALSRGAARVYFLEHTRAAVRVIRTNLGSLGIETGYEVLPRNAVTGLRQLRQRGVQLDVLFLDPPYAAIEEYERVLGQLDESLLSPTGWAIAEHSRKRPLAESYGSLRCTRRLTQGDSGLSFYRLS